MEHIHDLLHALAISAWVHAGPAAPAPAPEHPTVQAAGHVLVVGDCIAVGLGQQMRGAFVNAKVGISAGAVAQRVTPGYGEVIFSAGSNNINRRKQADDASITAALDRIKVNAGAARLLAILPANDARRAVAHWAAANGVPTVAFVAGADHVHPKSYRVLAQAVRAAGG